ncbi:hypothetical protein [Micromonospora sp. NPDC050200]
MAAIIGDAQGNRQAINKATLTAATAMHAHRQFRAAAHRRRVTLAADF